MASSIAVQVVVSPFLGLLFDKLSCLIEKEVGLIWGVDKEMKKLASTLSTIRDVLEDAEEKQIMDRAVTNWLLKLRALAYDADDILDEWATEAKQLNLRTEHVTCSKQVCGSYFSCFNFEQVMFRRKIVKRVNDLRRKFNDIALEKSNFHLSVGTLGRGHKHVQDRETSSRSADPRIYGRDVEKEFIVRLLLSDENSPQPVSVYPIVGIGGLGKTTLAQLCYNDHRVQEHYDVRIWVCVSDDFDVKRLTKAIIVSIGGHAHNIEELDPLQHLLEEKLAQKRFLLVLDDVWNENQEEWCRFINSLGYGLSGSSVIVTTRLKTVASITGTHPPFFLSFLSEDDCWSLFKQRAFGMGKEESPNLCEIGQEIVKKCGGVPLAAKVLGGLVRFKHGEKEWLNVRDSRLWELPYSDGNTILPALRLSYTHLDPQLRQCFAYCSVFPKDHVVEKDELIRLWLANGFIQLRGDMQMEDIGNEMFNDLAWRSFFQDEVKNSDGIVVSFKMHDLVHDLACSISMNECYHLANSTQIGNVHLGTRHLSIDLSTDSLSVTQSIHQLAPNLRTLILLKYKCGDDINLLCLKSLRALSLKQEKGYLELVDMKLLNAVGTLKHLRYLNLSQTKITLLPESICELRNLQTLELENCYDLVRFPEDMKNMSSLRHLNIKGCYNLRQMPNEIERLTCLQTLSTFLLTEWFLDTSNGGGIKELQGLDCLSGDLELRGLEHLKTLEEAKQANLMKKQNLVSLKLVWGRGPPKPDSGYHHRDVLEGLQPSPNLKSLDILAYEGLAFPSWLDVSSSLQNLVRVSILFCAKCEHLPSFGRLRLLKHLVLRSVESVKFLAHAGLENDFPTLEYLELCSMPNLEDWFAYYTGNSEEVIGFPRLKELVIQNCPKLKRLPLSPLSLLETLSVSDCNQMILGSLQNLPCLSSLNISSFDDITSFPEGSLVNLPSLKYLAIRRYDCLQSLPELRSSYLTKLDIFDCPNLTNVSLVLRYQTSLQSLQIKGCPKAEISTLDYQHLNSLRSLFLQELTSFPDGLRNLCSTLRKLTISYCVVLRSLPDWMGSFTNLEHLNLYCCENLRSLPEGFQLLSNLQLLSIWRCHPGLHERCKKETGEDWPKIAHVPHLSNDPCRHIFSSSFGDA